MPLKLERALKREVDIGGVTHTVTISPLGVRLVRKGFRKGVAVSWRRLLALAVGEAPAGDRPASAASNAASTDPSAADAGLG